MPDLKRKRLLLEKYDCCQLVELQKLLLTQKCASTRESRMTMTTLAGRSLIHQSCIFNLLLTTSRILIDKILISRIVV